METVYELLADLPASATLRAPPASLPAREVRATSYKVGNYLRSRGVHRGSGVGVADVPDPKTVFAFLGSALLAAPVTFDPPGSFDGRAVVAPTDALADYDLGAGGQRVGYGAKPDDPADGHFEGGVWSENPAFPPVSFDGDVPALRDAEGGDGPSQRLLLDAAGTVAADLDADDVVAVRAPFADDATVVAVLGAFRAGATVLLPGVDDGEGAEGATGDTTDGPVGDVAIVTGDVTVPEDRVLAP
ncbi:hypothetical protein J2752_002261 [Halarchaeum rubridurum]|uniref:AMP-binding enzyme n=1 Tax=Halarchaeum rubridurum TaxID=489911 RepID=A0A830G281_9EURY|nr:hypothetical protein [Halarchaeum rubridurum]MBP1955338.1 hypothetical protein [Halarchaeum rubridurum]GGM71612.1 hypothetical protein GCM10009017_21930 [Halarchaeum rubridurum]